MNPAEAVNQTYSNTIMHNFFLIQGIQKGSDVTNDYGYLNNFDGILGLVP